LPQVNFLITVMHEISNIEKQMIFSVFFQSFFAFIGYLNGFEDFIFYFLVRNCYNIIILKKKPVQKNLENFKNFLRVLELFMYVYVFRKF
jgi:hypothetical protein